MTSSTTCSKYSEFQVLTLIKVALFSGVAVCVSFAPGMTDNAASSISIVASVTSTLLGFIIAAAAILVAVIDKPFMQNLSKTGHLRKVLRQLMQSGLCMLMALVSCLVALFVSKTIMVYVCAVSFGFLAVALTDLIDCSNKLMKVMARL